MAPTERPLLSNGLDHHRPRPAGLTPNDHPALHAWQRHLDAGRIGTRTRVRPETLANIRAMESVLRRGRGGVR